MKALKVLGFIVVLLVVAAFVFWLGWLKPPAAEDVCGNVSALMEKEMGSKLDDAAMKDCVSKYSREPQYGLMPWTKKLKCIRDAGSLADAQKCEK